MNKVNFYVGVDISSEFFTVSILDSSVMNYLNFENSISGFASTQKTIVFQFNPF